MDIKKLTRIFQPHIVALLGLFALNVLFFSPLVNGKKLKQEDINQFEYITRFNEKSDDKSIVSKYSDNFNGTIDQSLWTDNMLGGMPVYLIHNDPLLYDPVHEKRVECRALNIPEELGQVQYMFCDKVILH